MPIKPENRKLYPKDWKAISKRVRFECAKGKCEWCGVAHGAEGARDKNGTFREVETIGLHDEDFDCDVGSVHLIRIILTVAHLNHDPTDNRDENLKALCQRCHNRHDQAHRQANAKRTRADKAVGPMFKS